MSKQEQELPEIDLEKYNFKDPEDYVYKAPKGLSEDLVREISNLKDEPEWMLKMRLRGFKAFMSKPLPWWGPDLSKINFDEIIYYIKPTERKARSWDEVPEYIKKTFERLGIPEAEQKFLAGVGAQYESEVIYHNTRKDLEKEGVVFLDMDSGLREYPEIVKKYFGTVVPPEDNKFAALNTAFWSGGSFVYVPEGVEVKIPLYAYFRINAANVGQFERTLIIAEPGSTVHYVEGCTAPRYSTQSLHAAVVEVIAMKGAKVRYTTIQNWSKDVYNLVTKRAKAEENATIEWIDGNFGSKVTMKYPAIILAGRGAKAKVISLAYSGHGQIIDAGAKAIHLAPDTSSTIISKSISARGGWNIFRGLFTVSKKAENAKLSINCDALLLDERSRSDTFPHIEINNETATVGHEARVGRIGDEQLFYLMSRGLTEQEALNLIVMGFVEPFVKELPPQFAIELHKLLELEMEGSVG